MSAFPFTYEQALLKAGCKMSLSHPYHAERSPQTQLSEMATWLEHNMIDGCALNSGTVFEAFEKQIAELLGLEAATFITSGKMACQIAIKIWCEVDGKKTFAMHPTSHMEEHENRSYSFLHDLKGIVVGSRLRSLNPADVKRIADPFSVLSIELPTRHAAGMLPSWDELCELKKYAKDRRIKLHLDGARLWTCQRYYANRTFAQICDGFDSVYVSFCKDIGASSGSILAGSKQFISKAKLWAHRQGDSEYQCWQSLVSAMMSFHSRINQMPLYCDRAKSVATLLQSCDLIKIKPFEPHTNIILVYLPFPVKILEFARNKLATQDKFWIADWFSPCDIPDFSFFELCVGDTLVEMNDHALIRNINTFTNYAADIAKM
jgi:threonine aldolase